MPDDDVAGFDETRAAAAANGDQRRFAATAAESQQQQPQFYLASGARYVSGGGGGGRSNHGFQQQQHYTGAPPLRAHGLFHSRNAQWTSQQPTYQAQRRERDPNGPVAQAVALSAPEMKNNSIIGQPPPRRSERELARMEQMGVANPQFHMTVPVAHLFDNVTLRCLVCGTHERELALCRGNPHHKEEEKKEEKKEEQQVQASDTAAVLRTISSGPLLPEPTLIAPPSSSQVSTTSSSPKTGAILENRQTSSIDLTQVV